MFQTITIPLSAFGAPGGFDVERLNTVRLRFDRAKAGVILLSKIGFE